MNASVFHFTRKRVAVVGVLTGAAALALSNLAPAGATTAHHAPEKKPTVVLVHGAFADSSSWNGVVERLKKDGYPVVAPANPLRGLTSDADYVRSFLKSVKGPVVLAGHSYGGAVISKAAEGEPNVEALVYIAAFAPDKGESALELSNKYPGSTLGPTLNTVPFPLPGGGTGNDLYIKADKFHQQFAADVPSRISDLMAATQRPVAASALEEPATGAAWKTVPSWNLVTTQDLNIPAAAQRFMAQRAHSHTTEIKASHAVTVSRPDVVTRVIEQAARATVGN
ncbi:pimeloyl-ACP methyl ester carboxylesterase [Streptomyces sp. T12]|uniref:alpha/beta fold hydrolase n=1 Tax=Streptomyces sp. T12 TaxID=477697 RepID=UPI00119F191D|nr:alpha/beta hydrolase [Streptomyces sp. T12]TWD17468.1 pimeloyl-ACP methyl ester carboxylesterase [Streptomyces sp. T12]